MSKFTKSTTDVGYGAFSPPEQLELDAGQPHDHLVEAATLKAKAAALTMACHLPDQPQRNLHTARGPPDQPRPWLLSDRQVGILLG
jgi:hypothetical protein